MNYLRQGNILTQIKNYFSIRFGKNNNEESANEKEKVKLEEGSSVRYGHEDSSTSFIS